MTTLIVPLTGPLRRDDSSPSPTDPACMVMTLAHENNHIADIYSWLGQGEWNVRAREIVANITGTHIAFTGEVWIVGLPIPTADEMIVRFA